MKKKKESMMVEFSLEITAEILSRLPVDSIGECMLVCKTWQTLIDNDFGFVFTEQPFGFIYFTLQSLFCYGEYYYPTTSSSSSTTTDDHEKAKEELAVFDHLKITTPFKFPPQELEQQLKRSERSKWTILGSSDGLICLSSCRLDHRQTCSSSCRFGLVYQYVYDIYVYNPMTSEFVDLGTETHSAAVDGFRASGFGYHYHPSSTKEYKVVRINYKTKFSQWGQVRVYTLGSGSWRDKGEIPYVIMDDRKPGVLVNGALYWITLDEKILSFDLADEEFRIVPKPRRLNLCKTSGLGVLRGCLCVGTTENKGSTNLWVMNYNKKLYMSSSTTTTTTDDGDKAWTRFPIALYKPPHISDWLSNELSSYGLKFQSFRIFRNRLDIIPYEKSCVSLKALGEENTKKICSSS